jgi:catechol 2,3-dioxygenase-like lactoylglutathione lyase family enzyme
VPKIDGVLETSLYVDDLRRSIEFYRSVLGFDVIESNERIAALKVANRQVLLLCRKGASAGATLGAHDGDGRLHLAFAVPTADLDAWEVRLQERSVPIEEKRRSEYGGHSLYFRDPDQHLIEFATHGTWSIY